MLTRTMLFHLICLIGFFIIGCGSKEIYMPPQNDAGQSCINIAKTKYINCERQSDTIAYKCIYQAKLDGQWPYKKAMREHERSRKDYEDCERDNRRARRRGGRSRSCSEPSGAPRRSDYIKTRDCYDFWKYSLNICKNVYDNTFLSCGGRIEHKKS